MKFCCLQASSKTIQSTRAGVCVCVFPWIFFFKFIILMNAAQIETWISWISSLCVCVCGIRFVFTVDFVFVWTVCNWRTLDVPGLRYTPLTHVAILIVKKHFFLWQFRCISSCSRLEGFLTMGRNSKDAKNFERWWGITSEGRIFIWLEKRKTSWEVLIFCISGHVLFMCYL